ncbi:hypothetical protein KI387_012133, partial [Taxus chinensis]
LPDVDYSGSLKKGCRFAAEVLEAVVDNIGTERMTIRLLSIIDHIGTTDSDPLSLTSHLLRLLNFIPLAYLYMTEPRFTKEGLREDLSQGNCMAAKMWNIMKNEYKGRLMRSGGYMRQTVMEVVSSCSVDMISFDKLFISNI